VNVTKLQRSESRSFPRSVDAVVHLNALKQMCKKSR